MEMKISNLQRLYMNNIIILLIIYICIIISIYLLKIKSFFFIYKIILKLCKDNFNIYELLKVGLKIKVRNINPQKIYDNIHEISTLDKIELDLKNLKGIYGFLCKMNCKLYIGSSANLVTRFKEHIKGKKSNSRLQRAFSKYGLNNFYFVVFESYNLDYDINLIDLETSYLSYFKLKSLYNFKFIANSLLGYRHSDKSIEKMINRYNFYKHPMLGKHHSLESKLKISLAMRGNKNPMYGKEHSK